MSGIVSYDLSGDQAESLLAALKGSEEKQRLWIKELQRWLDRRQSQMKIYDLTKEWLTDYASRTGICYGHDTWLTDEENLEDWVYHQLEYCSGLIWDNQTKSVIVNRHISPPLLREEPLKELLNYLTNKLEDRLG